MNLAFVSESQGIEPIARDAKTPLSEADAVDIWIARWLRIRPVDLVRRYRCDPRRLYEIWEGTKFPGARDIALEAFRVRYPTLVGRIDTGTHRRLTASPHPDQLTLFQ